MMKITIFGYTEFTVKVANSGEAKYDYVVVGTIDTAPTTSAYKAKIDMGTAAVSQIAQFTDVTFSDLDGGQHVIYISYIKDGSNNSGQDRGFVIIPKQ